jgi:hypothetical protein
MIGASALRRMQQFEAMLETAGMEWKTDHDLAGSDMIGIYPRHDSLPIYSRDAQLYRGDMDGCMHWLRGWFTAREYLTHLGFSTDLITKRETKIHEQNEAKRLMTAMATGKDPGPDHCLVTGR